MREYRKEVCIFCNYECSKKERDRLLSIIGETGCECEYRNNYLYKKCQGCWAKAKADIV